MSDPIGYDLSGHQKGLDVARLVRERSPAWLAFKLTEAQGFIDRESLILLDEAARVAPEVPRSGYQFAWANRDGAAQGKTFVAQDRQAPTNARPVVDIEGVWDPVKKKIVDVPEVGPVRALATYRAIVEEIEAGTGNQAVIYTSPGFIATFFSAPAIVDSDDAQFLASRSLWIAHYGVRIPTTPLFWARAGKTCSAWQDDGGQKTFSPDGKPIDHNIILRLEDLVISPAVAPTPIELEDIRDPNREFTIERFLLDLVERPGGQA